MGESKLPEMRLRKSFLAVAGCLLLALLLPAARPLPAPAAEPVIGLGRASPGEAGGPHLR